MAPLENEQSKQISNKKLLEDISITQAELEAYQHIVTGFTMLAQLPDRVRLYQVEIMFYGNKEQECREFLRKLHVLKAERGL